MLRGKEAAPVRVYTIYLMFSGVERERERQRKRKKRNGINQKRQKGNVYRL